MLCSGRIIWGWGPHGWAVLEDSASAQWQPSPASPGYYWVRLGTGVTTIVHFDLSADRAWITMVGSEEIDTLDRLGAVAWLPIQEPSPPG